MYELCEYLYDEEKMICNHLQNLGGKCYIDYCPKIKKLVKEGKLIIK